MKMVKTGVFPVYNLFNGFNLEERSQVLKRLIIIDSCFLSLELTILINEIIIESVVLNFLLLIVVVLLVIFIDRNK